MVSASDLTGSEQKQSEPLKNISAHPTESSGTHPTVSLQPAGFPGLPDGWVSDWETFSSADDELQLFAVLHHPRKWTECSALVILHGYGEHGGRYQHFPHFVQSEVGSVYCLDQRGHGRAEGLRGDTERFDYFVEDAAVAVRRLDEQLKNRFGRSEIHLLGHSLGGLIALRLLLLHPKLPLCSATISAPLLRLRQNVSFTRKLGVLALSRVWGSLQLSTGLDATKISHDKEVVNAYLTDRLVHDKMTPRFFVEMTKACEDTFERDSGMQPPVQFLVPLVDQIVDSDKSIEYFKKLKHPRKRLKTYPNFYHESFNEIGKETAFEDLLSWIRENHRE